jgi:hypothetical protein
MQQSQQSRDVQQQNPKTAPDADPGFRLPDQQGNTAPDGALPKTAPDTATCRSKSPRRRDQSQRAPLRDTSGRATWRSAAPPSWCCW